MSEVTYQDRIMETFFAELENLRKDRERMQQRLEGYRLQNNSLSMPVSTNPFDGQQTPSLLDLLRMRLRTWGRADTHYGLSPHPFEHVSVIENAKADEVVVFILKDGKEILLRDEIGLYPSDRLITQIRLLMA